ncbi:sn-glycerol-3-phosphate-binding periplasmic protein UgpB precursor [compost metagenome]
MSVFLPVNRMKRGATKRSLLGGSPMKHRLTAGFMMLTIILALVLGGCGATSSSGAAGKTTDEAGSEKVTLKFWYPNAGEIATKAIKETIASFEAQHSGISVDLTVVPWDQYFQKLAVAYSGGTQPDVHGLGFGQLISTVDQGKYLNLQPYIDKDKWEGASDFFPDIWKSGQWKGGQYGLLMPDVRPLAWRKDFFKEAGLDPESPPKTVDELFDYANKLKKTENGQTVRSGLDIQTSNGEQSYLSLLLLLGQNFYDDKGDPQFDSDVSIKLVERLVDLYKSGGFMASNQQSANGTPFQNSQAAMAFISASQTASLTASVGGDKIGWSLPPEGTDGSRTSLMLGTFLTAASATKHPEEAWEFIKFWFSKDNILKYTTETGNLPPLQSVKADYLKAHPENEISYEAMKNAQGYPPAKEWSIDVKYLRLALEEAYNGIKAPADALKENAKLARDEIAAAQ